MTLSDLPGDKDGGVGHPARLVLFNLVIAKLVQFSLESTLLLVGQLLHVDGRLVFVRHHRCLRAVFRYGRSERGGSYRSSLGHVGLSRSLTSRSSSSNGLQSLRSRSNRSLRSGLSSGLLGVFLQDVTSPGNNDLFVRRAERTHSGDHGGVSTSTGELPVGVTGYDGSAVRLLELLHSLRRKYASGEVAGASDGRGHEPILIETWRVGSRFRCGRRTENTGDLDRKVVTQMDDSSRERESLFLVGLLEMFDLSLDLFDRQRSRGRWVGSHVIHCCEGGSGRSRRVIGTIRRMCDCRLNSREEVRIEQCICGSSTFQASQQMQRRRLKVVRSRWSSQTIGRSEVTIHPLPSLMNDHHPVESDKEKDEDNRISLMECFKINSRKSL